ILDAVVLRGALAGYARGDEALEAVGAALHVARVHRLAVGSERRGVGGLVVAHPQALARERLLLGELADVEVDGLVIAARRPREDREHVPARDVLRRAEDLRDLVAGDAADFRDDDVARGVALERARDR